MYFLLKLERSRRSRTVFVGSVETALAIYEYSWESERSPTSDPYATYT